MKVLLFWVSSGEVGMAFFEIYHLVLVLCRRLYLLLYPHLCLFWGHGHHGLGPIYVHDLDLGPFHGPYPGHLDDPYPYPYPFYLHPSVYPYLIYDPVLYLF